MIALKDADNLHVNHLRSLHLCLQQSMRPSALLVLMLEGLKSSM